MNNNNDENQSTNRTPRTETCTKTFVNNSINIDMNRFSEFSVLNLSDYSLNQTDLRLLSKGLTFTPTPDVVNMGEIKSDLDRFLRKIRLTLYFSKEISEDDTIASTSPNLATQNISEFEDKLKLSENSEIKATGHQKTKSQMLKSSSKLLSRNSKNWNPEDDLKTTSQKMKHKDSNSYKITNTLL